MVIAYDRQNDAEDTIMFERNGFYEVHARKNFVPVRSEVVENSGEESYSRAEKIFEAWSSEDEISD
jgi:hypothetical protein